MRHGLMLLVLAVAPAVVAAQSTQEIIDGLKDTRTVRTRAINVDNGVDAPAPLFRTATPPRPVIAAAPVAAAPVDTPPERPGRHVELRDVEFYVDSIRFKPDSEPTLANIAVALKSPELAALRFRVVGHTDASGNPGHNQSLSDRRAQAVIAWLADNGVPSDRLTPVGRAAREPKYADAYDPRNRRVEIER